MANGSTDLREQLSQAELAALRGGCQPRAMVSITSDLLASSYPPGAPYIGAMVDGLDVQELAHTVLLVGAYGGVSTYAAGLIVLRRTVEFLKSEVASGEVGTPDVVRGLISVFQPALASPT